MYVNNVLFSDLKFLATSCSLARVEFTSDLEISKQVSLNAFSGRDAFTTGLQSEQ